MVTPSKAGENVEKPASQAWLVRIKSDLRTVWQPPQDSMTAPQGIYPEKYVRFTQKAIHQCLEQPQLNQAGAPGSNQVRVWVQLPGEPTQHRTRQRWRCVSRSWDEWLKVNPDSGFLPCKGTLEMTTLQKWWQTRAAGVGAEVVGPSMVAGDGQAAPISTVGSTSLVPAPRTAGCGQWGGWVCGLCITCYPVSMY